MKLTPGMRQYMEQKEKYPDCILLFRMGDFYETFFDDAVKVAKLLNITLTSRGKGETKAPLAGIPYHSIDRYIGKLVNAGNKVAICEQMEDPKAAKGIVKRDVVRIITPGTAIEDSILEVSTNNFIASVFGEDAYGVAFADISTGELNYTELEKLEDVLNELARKKVAELVISHPTQRVNEFCTQHGIFLNKIPEDYFWLPKSQDAIIAHYKSSTKDMGFDEREFGLCAMGALIRHLHDTQKQGLNYLKKPQFFTVSDYMKLDSATIKNLELIRNIHEATTRGSLLSVLDKTMNPLGSRAMKFWITHPLKDRMKINERLGAVQELKQKIIECDDVREILGNLFDIERLVSKISYRMTSPRDLVNLKQSLFSIPKIKQGLSSFSSTCIKKLIAFDDVTELVALIDKTISEESEGQEIIRSGAGYSEGGSGRREIGIIKRGYSLELDELYDIKLHTKEKIRELEQSEQERTGIPLKVGYNKIFGYYIEITNRHKEQVPPHFFRKQTLVNGERFITEELKSFEEKLLHAEQRIIAIEDIILSEVVNAVIASTDKLQRISEKIAALDVLCAFAKVAYENNYVMPEVTEEYGLALKDCRHPVIEQLQNEFVPNDCHLDDREFVMLITGPNMAGKSTFMRQIALTILMAQIGSFVPASHAKVSIVDQIFSRVGAYDDLTMGQSTFMVEMVETARILNSATRNSFIILDEIGRGTSTFDGVAIAWSVAEHLLKKIHCKTLFATHYHVLTKLEQHQLRGIVNYNIAVAEEADRIIFLRKIHRGGTDRSYGIQVAKLAGLPDEVIENAKLVQMRLENEDEMSQRISFEKKSEQGKKVTEKVEQKKLEF